MLQILGGADVPRIRDREASALVKFAKLRALLFNRLHGLRSDRLISFRLVEPQSSIASSSSRRKISSTLSTPSCPATVNPQRIGRPTNTAPIVAATNAFDDNREARATTEPIKIFEAEIGFEIVAHVSGQA